MPSDAAKKRKEAEKKKRLQREERLRNAKAATNGTAKAATNGPAKGAASEGAKATANGTTTKQTNGQVNGTSSESKPSKKQLKKEIEEELQGIQRELDDLDIAAQHRAVTGVLSSHPDGGDVHIGNLSITFHGREMLVDTEMKLNMGSRYGLIGPNGCGKSSLLAAIGNREMPIPRHVDIFLLKREMPPSDKTPLQCVMEVDEERVRLEKEAELLATKTSDEANDRLMDVYERLDELESDMAMVKAAELLHGLGFTKEMQHKAVKHFSGGWRMRIALARALFIKPALLLLDEPTNHLDLDACVWLEQELKNYKRCLMLISHSQDFLNGVCTNIVHMHQQKLQYYGGNYDTYVKTRMELEENQMKKYRWEQDQIAHMKNYIARFGHGNAKLARQAQSKEKTLKKMVDAGLTEKVARDKNLAFYFPDCGKVPPPVIMVQNVSFKYADDKPLIYKNLEFGVDLDSRIALVGPNGAGKSTLLKLIAGELMPSDGLVRRHSHLRIGRYHQHLQEILDMEMTALEWMMKKFPEIKEREEMRKIIGRYGLSGQQQICPIRNLSDGQRCRIIFAWLAWNVPHMLLLDEPTNHLDIETIDALADAINDYEGGMLLVSHDFRLISQVATEIWECKDQTIKKWTGDIFDYKKNLVKNVKKENDKRI